MDSVTYFIGPELFFDSGLKDCIELRKEHYESLSPNSLLTRVLNFSSKRTERILALLQISRRKPVLYLEIPHALVDFGTILCECLATARV
jgi:hypothetical protein